MVLGALRGVVRLAMKPGDQPQPVTRLRRHVSCDPAASRLCASRKLLIDTEPAGPLGFGPLPCYQSAAISLPISVAAAASVLPRQARTRGRVN